MRLYPLLRPLRLQQQVGPHRAGLLEEVEELRLGTGRPRCHPQCRWGRGRSSRLHVVLLQFRVPKPVCCWRLLWSARSRRPRWSAVLLAMRLCQQRVVPSLPRSGPRHLSFLLPTLLRVDRSQGEVSVDTTVRVREVELDRCLCKSVIQPSPHYVLARTSAPLGVIAKNCPMCAAPSVVALLGSMFFRSVRCIISISVPCAIVTSASVNAIGLTLAPSLSSGTISAVLVSLLSMLRSKLLLLRVLQVPLQLLWLFLSPLRPGAGRAFEYANSPFDRFSLRFRVLCAPRS